MRKALIYFVLVYCAPSSLYRGPATVGPCLDLLNGCLRSVGDNPSNGRVQHKVVRASPKWVDGYARPKLL